MNTVFHRLIILSGVSLLLGSCTKQLLEKDPISSLPAEGFYQSLNDAKAGINGIYNAAQGTFRTNFAYWGEGRADNVQTEQSGDPLLLAQNNLNSVMSSASWTNLYILISRANYAIEYIPQIKTEGDNLSYKQQLVGQARALRALAYFYLVRIWGDVPLILDPYTSRKQEFFVQKTDTGKVLDQIEEDLEYAAEHCVKTYNNTNNRIFITQGTANALLTQVYMWRHKYKEAIQSSKLVLDNDLYDLESSIPDWSKIFTNGYSQESIFEIAYQEGQATNSLRVLYALGSYAIYTPSEKFRSSYEQGDRRIAYIYDTTLAEPKAIWKFLGKGVSDESSAPADHNIVLIRLAGIMLLRAEALAHLGGNNNINEALNLLNQIRNRAGLPKFADVAEANAMYGSLEEAILHERSIELCFEGYRWFDLVRTGTAISTMGPVNGISNKNNLVWPISRSALNKNPQLVQNKFYR